MAAEQLIEALRNEHRAIKRVLAALEVKTRELERPPFPRMFFERALEQLSSFAGRCHLAKEEERFFPLLWEKGIPLEKRPLGPLMNDHEQGCRHLTAIRARLTAAEQGAPEALGAIRAEVGAYIRFMREHMDKEERRLFNMARTLLSPEDAERLEREFADVEQEQTA